MRPRVGDVLGAALLTIVLFALVAVIFVGAIGEAERIRAREAGSEAVAGWQL